VGGGPGAIRTNAARSPTLHEELVVTYVDPSLGVRERRSQLVAWGFGQCDCERCVKEEREGRSCGDEGEGEIKSDRIWTTWRESSRQDWASCNNYKITCCFPESFHRDYDDGGPLSGG
jgi:hypothetical protein